jgi:uncharacterized membrane protein (DUF4010 family)
MGAGIAATAWGAVFTVLGLRAPPPAMETVQGRVFSVPAALGFATIVAVMLVVAAGVTRWAGDAGLVVACALAGFADTHAAAVSAASLVREGRIEATAAALPVLAAFTTNALMKSVLAILHGDRRFIVQVVPGIALTVAGAWGAFLMTR